MYQVATRFYLPWEAVEPTPEMEELITIDVDCDRTQLSVNDEVRVSE